jgi:predicted dehydrogenase
MKFLIAGFGSTGRRHLRNLQALGERDVVLLRSGRSTLPTDEIEGLPVETDLAEALAHRPDAVIISNPTALHLQVAVPAAEQGCSIFCEKPVADSLEGIPALRSALARGGGQFLTGFQFRFHPTLQQAKRWLEEGAIGRPVFTRVHWGEWLPGWHPWEDYRASYSARKELGGGVVLTLCHPFDYLRWLLGDVSSVFANTAKLSDLELDVEDTAEISFRFSSGALGSVHLNYVQRPPVHRWQMVGTEGTLVWDNASGGAQVYRVSTGEWESVGLPDGFERNDLFLNELRHFIDVTAGKTRPVCDLEDGVKALELSLAALQSSREEAVVRLG